MPFREESGSSAFGGESASDSPVTGPWDLRLSLEGRVPCGRRLCLELCLSAPALAEALL